MSDAISQASGNTTSTASTQATAGAAAPAPAAPAAAPAAAAPAAASQQATEGQTAAPATAPAPAAASPAEPPKTTEPAKAAVAPEKYEFKAPAGVELDADTAGAFSEVARKAGLSQEAAQEVIDSIAPKLAAQNVKAFTAAIERVNTEWATAVKADPEIGGEKLSENLATAKKAVERFASPALRGLLEPFDATKNPKGMGLGNNPEFIRLFFKLGKAISEDGFVPGGTKPQGTERTAADILYPQQAAKR